MAAMEELIEELFEDYNKELLLTDDGPLEVTISLPLAILIDLVFRVLFNSFV